MLSVVDCKKLGWDAYLALLSLTELGVTVETISVNVDGTKDEGTSDGGCTTEDAHATAVVVVVNADSLFRDLREFRSVVICNHNTSKFFLLQLGRH